LFSAETVDTGRIRSRVWLIAHVADLRRLYWLRYWRCRVAVVVLVGGDTEDSGQGVATGVGKCAPLCLRVALSEEDVHSRLDGFSALRFDENRLELPALDWKLHECKPCLLERFFDGFEDAIEASVLIPKVRVDLVLSNGLHMPVEGGKSLGYFLHRLEVFCLDKGEAPCVVEDVVHTLFEVRVVEVRLELVFG